MITKEKISTFQLGTLIIGFIIGDFILLIPSKVVGQNAWMPVLISGIGGIILISLYVFISKIHPQRTLVDIIYFCFGKFFGTIFIVLYINYFLQLAAIIARTIADYMIVVNYTRTPLFFILLLILIIVSYDIRKGMEVVGRLAEISIPIVLTFIFLTTLLLIPKYKLDNIYPIMENGIKPILKESFYTLTFPFGETVVFLMIFPFLNDNKKLLKTSVLSMGIAVIILVIVTLRNILVLGHNLMVRSSYPTHTVASLVPELVIEPIVSINLLVSGGAQIVALVFATVIGITQLFKLDDYKPVVLPVGLFLVPFAMWYYDSTPQMAYTAREVLPYFAIFFQVVIPILLLLISLIKLKLKKSGN
ncbi:endospore germination permease [Clostridium sp. D2Q-11]|uniref:Endospore germination permease n=1 Tax=Anaeromonas frigoriresistens TaxID=2683708 RepID=A0A942UU35_9FIRM|nr:endospore germination permease [Anaeromonas frigoriresistens]MBS4539264.1 endospore germination permease [Anaeromonas frigoriresistens]